MKRSFPLSLLLLFLAVAIPATAKPKKPSLPEAFETAHTVFVEERFGHDITDIALDPDTRRAILDVQDGVEKWGRYTLSRSRRDADLVLVVYKGHLLGDSNNPGTIANPRSPISRAPAPNTSDASQGSLGPSPDGPDREKDELRVYTLQSDGKLKGPIWHSEEENGLNSSRLILLQRLKAEVEKAYPTTPANLKPIP